MEHLLESDDREIFANCSMLPEEIQSRVVNWLSSKNKAVNIANALIRVKENDIGKFHCTNPYYQ